MSSKCCSVRYEHVTQKLKFWCFLDFKQYIIIPHSIARLRLVFKFSFVVAANFYFLSWFQVMDISVAGEELVGRRIKVWWPLDRKWVLHKLAEPSCPGKVEFKQKFSNLDYNWSLPKNHVTSLSSCDSYMNH